MSEPVTVPPGWARLATTPTPSGSPIAAITMGIVAVAACADFAAGVPQVTIEVKRGVDPAAAIAVVKREIKRVFELTPRVETLELGTLAREFEASVKAPRIVDRRS